MNLPIRPNERRPDPPAGDLEMAQTYLLNALLKAKRRLVRREIGQAEYDVIRARIDEALAPIRLLAVAVETPSLHVLTYDARRR